MEDELILPKTSRRPRLERVRGQSIDATDTLNIQILKLVAGSRFISGDAICRVFGGSKNTLQVRLLKLFHAGYLDRPPTQELLRKQRGTTALIYALGPKGAALLGEPVKKNNDLGEAFIEHGLMVSHFFCAVFSACQKHGITLGKWEPEPETPGAWVQEANRRIALRPDAVFELHHQKADLFYLEAERGTVARWRSNWEQSSFWRKILYYTALYDQVRENKIPNFRVLTVTPYLDHLNYLRELCRKADSRGRGLNLFWFTLEENINLEDPSPLLFEPLWFVPSDTEPRKVL